ncbi:MAG: RAMP superfamily CRISPR-associated protein [Armatimonadetes bacterium]|nr:RAMP superfamily CRISPR-associated protein [Armatimonadota bacterium]MDW8028161.1 RAMP superfamily CRISPR-associated protein [Armatimonadota bacterium]
MQGQNQPEPKPFVLVPIPKDEPQRSRAMTFEKFSGLTGQMELEFKVVSEFLFVGSGGYEFDPNSRADQPDVWHTFYRRNGQICVPGTSLKGSIRAIVEAISNSCVLQTRRGERVSSRSHQRCEFKSVEQSQICPACRLFGTTGLRGRVNFSDAIPTGNAKLQVEKIHELWEPKKWTNARRFYELKNFQPSPNRRPERNYRFVEAVPKETCFVTTLNFENLSHAELGLLLYALGLEPKDGRYTHAFTPKLGGAKPRCFGAVKFEPKRAKLLRYDDWLAFLNPKILEGDELISFVQTCLQSCQNENLLHKDSWRTFVSGMKPKQEPCPRGNY